MFFVADSTAAICITTIHIVTLMLNVAIIGITNKKVENKIIIPIYDVIITNIGVPLSNYYWLPDVFVIISFVLMTPFITLPIYIRFMEEHAILLVIRFVTIFSTTGYVSARHHLLKVNNYSSKTPGVMNAGYADLTISGHATTMVLFLYHICDSCSMLYMLVASLIISFGILSNILNGDHYTSDVILAIILTYLVHY
jgi:hypothetical protein